MGRYDVGRKEYIAPTESNILKISRINCHRRGIEIEANYFYPYQKITIYKKAGTPAVAYLETAIEILEELEKELS